MCVTTEKANSYSGRHVVAEQLAGAISSALAEHAVSRAVHNSTYSTYSCAGGARGEACSRQPLELAPPLEQTVALLVRGVVGPGAGVRRVCCTACTTRLRPCHAPKLAPVRTPLPVLACSLSCAATLLWRWRGPPPPPTRPAVHAATMPKHVSCACLPSQYAAGGVQLGAGVGAAPAGGCGGHEGAAEPRLCMDGRRQGGQRPGGGRAAAAAGAADVRRRAAAAGRAAGAARRRAAAARAGGAARRRRRARRCSRRC